MLRICNKLVQNNSHLLLRSALCSQNQLRASLAMRRVHLRRPRNEFIYNQPNETQWPRKIFSGIQPTGQLHLGNYLGAVRKWKELQDSGENVTISIVDMHSITLPQNPPELRENIFQMTAALLACGLDPALTTMFVQSSIVEHSEFNWILNCMTTMPRLGQLPQFKEKSRTLREIPLGLYVYPVLQAADIMLHKATHVPIGADQIQHIQLAQHLARTFNKRYGEMFPVCSALLGSKNMDTRIRSLRNPLNKMSKSDTTPKATIYITDPPEVIIEKIKKAVTDITSDVSYEPVLRPGVSNLVTMHSLITNTPIKNIIDEARSFDTGKYKLHLANVLIEHLNPIRERMQKNLERRSDLIHILEKGAEKARQVAYQTMVDVKQRIGLGTFTNTPQPIKIQQPIAEPPTKMTASQRVHRLIMGRSNVTDENSDVGATEQNIVVGGGGLQKKSKGAAVMRIKAFKGKHTIPEVPQQKLRVEKERKSAPATKFEMDAFPTPMTIPFRNRANNDNVHNPFADINRNSVDTDTVTMNAIDPMSISGASKSATHIVSSMAKNNMFRKTNVNTSHSPNEFNTQTMNNKIVNEAKAETKMVSSSYFNNDNKISLSNKSSSKTKETCTKNDSKTHNLYSSPANTNEAEVDKSTEQEENENRKASTFDKVKI